VVQSARLWTPRLLGPVVIHSRRTRSSRSCRPTRDVGLAPEIEIGRVLDDIHERGATLALLAADAAQLDAWDE